MNYSNQQFVCVCEKCTHIFLSVLYLLIPLKSQKHDFFIWVTDYGVCEDVEIICTALWETWLVIKFNKQVDLNTFYVIYNVYIHLLFLLFSKPAS